MKSSSGYNKFLIINDYLKSQLNCVHSQMDKIKQNIPEDSPEKLDELAIRTAFERLLEREKYVKTAQLIFTETKRVLKARIGYLAIINAHDEDLEIIVSDTGKYEHKLETPVSDSCPLRGVRKHVLQTQKSICLNDFASSRYARYLPQGHVHVQNILISPMIINDVSCGVLTLANKKDGFDNSDICLSGLFAELAAMALENSHAWSYLGKMEPRSFRFSEYPWAEEVI